MPIVGAHDSASFTIANTAAGTNCGGGDTLRRGHHARGKP